MRPGVFKTRVITSLDDVPEGFVQVSDLFRGPEYAQRGGRGARNRRLISDAHKQGYIEAVKFFRTAEDAKTGPVFVRPSDADKYVSWWQERLDRTTVERKPAEVVDHDAAGREELRRLIDVTATLTTAIRDLQAAIELATPHHGEAVK